MLFLDNDTVEQAQMLQDALLLERDLYVLEDHKKTNKELTNPTFLERELLHLLEQKIESVEELEQWLFAESELFDEIQEILGRHQISFNQYMDNEEIRDQYVFDQEQLIPLLKEYSAKLDQKFYDSPYRQELDQEKYGRMIQARINSIQLYSEKNIPLGVEEDKLTNQYSEIISNVMINWEGEEKTLSQMSPYLQSNDREIREEAWRNIWQEVLSHEEELQEIMNRLIEIRHQKAVNAGFDNYRDYMFQAYGRFDYTPEDCFKFHDAVKQEIVPLISRVQQQHQKKLGVDTYRPWDTSASVNELAPLKPFETPDELRKKTISIMKKLDPQFAKVLKRMHKKNLLDLESRKAKSPGGFCAYLPVSQLSFILMNAAGNHGDISTMIHESGHAVHNMLKKGQDLRAYERVPMESAELASMSMELFSMDYWDAFYPDKEELVRAQRNQIAGVISLFPWVMVVDHFQHWLYENPTHSVEERNDKFAQLAEDFLYQHIDMTGLEDEMRARWLLQPHIFEVPFYYIEYAIAQIGAIQLWQNYVENPEQTIQQYKEALALGSSKPLAEVYETAGIRFDFSQETIRELMSFVQEQLQEEYVID